MAIDPVPLDGLHSRRTRLSCLAPLAVFTGAVAMALVGSGALTTTPQPPASADMTAASGASAPDAPSRVKTSSGSRTAELDNSRTPEVSPDDAAGGPPAHWAWMQMAPLDVAPVPDLPLDGGSVEPPRTAMIVPLPIPRPPEFRSSGTTAPVRRAERRVARRDVAPVQPAAPPADERSFLEKLFGIERAPALAYTALESKPFDPAPQRRISPPLTLSREPNPTAGVAVYNIAARTVTLPSGERLEAHSGLGEGLDEPRLVNIRMRGPTPPGTYDLTEREQLFHGVRAIRLTPVGGSEAVYGRVGLLAHTFMLGPRGDSNGCVSFRDYERFLQAFLRGEVQRLVVVTGTQDPLPLVVDGGRTRMARNGG
ncbi:Protein of unknown function [Methylobacterium phyllostachyos]|uniref:Tlde1 domain-containing protein n=1 Tax=Methylobacterium phyllostachyos TaxID=582672 RepID=A0A1G9UC65_9HYPH|nr:DUF2778 domain-containing protein [Methylobacterium phyllostachyos]SDM57499.1 Protein of unknown function [Methylobacterium phyllostachyos]